MKALNYIFMLLLLVGSVSAQSDEIILYGVYGLVALPIIFLLFAFIILLSKPTKKQIKIHEPKYGWEKHFKYSVPNEPLYDEIESTKTQNRNYVIGIVIIALIILMSIFTFVSLPSDLIEDSELNESINDSENQKEEENDEVDQDLEETEEEEEEQADKQESEEELSEQVEEEQMSQSVPIVNSDFWKPLLVIFLAIAGISLAYYGLSNLYSFNKKLVYYIILIFVVVSLGFIMWKFDIFSTIGQNILWWTVGFAVLSFIVFLIALVLYLKRKK